MKRIVCFLAITLLAPGCALFSSSEDDSNEAKAARCSAAAFLQPYDNFVDLEDREISTSVHAALHHHQTGAFGKALTNWRKAEVTLRGTDEPTTRAILFYNAAVSATHLGSFEQAAGLLENEADHLPQELHDDRKLLREFIGTDTRATSAESPENGEESAKKEGES